MINHNTSVICSFFYAGSEKWKSCTSTNHHKYTVSGLKEGNEYHFRVKAKNVCGYSAAEEILSAITVRLQPGTTVI